MRASGVSEPTLRTLERRLYRSTVDTGVWDAVLGASMLAIGGSIGWGRPFVGPPLVPVLVSVAVVVNRVLARRVGFVRFRPERVASTRRAGFTVPAVAGVLLVALLFAGPRLHGLVKAGLLLAIPTSAAAWLFEIRRLHGYAALVLLAVAAVLATRQPWELALIAPGLVITAAGLAICAHFVRRHPHRRESGHV
jgi:hypothetical protein